VKLSVAIICRDNEDTIERCLQSVQGAEIVVVDTGSKDKTKEIASKYSQVHDFVWCDDFSKARNFAIEKCTGDWILILDSDEWVDLDEVMDAIKDGDHDSISADVYYGDKKSHNHIRLIKPHVRYKFPIHEYPACVKTEVSNFKIHHEKGKHDPDRNLRMLVKAVDSDPLPRYKFYLSCEYFWKSDFIKSLYWMERYVKESTFINERSDGYLFIAKCLWRLRRGDEAREACLKAIMLNPNFKEALLFMASISWDHQAIVWKKFAEVADNSGVLFLRS